MTVPYYNDDWLTVYQGDCRAVMAGMEPESVHCVVTSPPYWGLRDYGDAGQLGLEPTPEAYVADMVAVFAEVRRVLRSDGTVWLNLGDSYAAGRGGTMMPAETLAGGVSGQGPATAHRGRPQVPDSLNPNAPAKTYQPHRNAEAIGLKHKDLVGIPWRVAFALQADGWYLRSDIIWSKPNPMPESVTDRPTKSHEYLFLLSKSPRYYFDAKAVAEAAEFSGPNGPQHSPYGQGFTRRSDKQAESVAVGIGNGHHVAGFNDRWDAKERATWAERKAAGAHPGGRGGPGQIVGTGTQRNIHGEGMSHDLGSGLTRNIRSVWTVATQPYPGAHFATFPEALVEPCVKAGSPQLGAVLDPFAGSGTTGRVAQRLGRRAVLIDLNADYLTQAMVRNQDIPLGLETA
jgi:DNA modification methylase